MNKLFGLVAGIALGAMLAVPVLAGEKIALEVVVSKPKPGVTLEQALAADKAMGEWVAAQKGFISRETATSKDGEIFVIVHWSTLEDAEAAGAAFMNAPAGKAALDAVDPSLFKHFVTQ